MSTYPLKHLWCLCTVCVFMYIQVIVYASLFLSVCLCVASYGQTHPRASLCEEAGRVCVMRTWRGVGGGDVSHLMVALSSRPSSSTAAIWQRNRQSRRNIPETPTFSVLKLHISKYSMCHKTSSESIRTHSHF